MAEPAKVTQLIPDFTLEDFMTEAPYAYLYANKDNRFLLQTMVEKMRMKAKQVGFGAFIKTWNEYVKAQKQNGTAVMGENDTDFPDQPAQLRCGAYECDENGVHRYSELTGDVEVISHPLMPVKRVTNIETYEEKMEIAYKRGRNGWKTITVPREVLASSQKIISLSRQGIDVNSENAKEVIRFMSKLESMNYDDLPMQNSVGHMGWLPNGDFLPYTNEITYDGDVPEFTKMYTEFRPTGSEEAWMEIAREVRAGDSVPARIALAAGFAGPLVKLLSALPFFVHIWGEKGCGKSVGLMLSASIWGNPEIGSYPKTFNGTKVSFEQYAAFCCNLPLYLDELQVINDNRKNFDEIIYMLCEGANKGRGSRDGGLQLQRQWRTCIVTTGETPIIQSNSGGGAAVRTIEVNYKNTPLFGTDERAREVANLLKENYGHAGKKFIAMLQQEDVQAALWTLQKKYYRDLSGDIDGKQVLSASILLAADALATIGIFNDKRGLTTDEIREFLITKTESDVNRRCYEFLLDWLDRNPRRFDPVDNNSGESWGIIDGDVAYINKSVFEDVLRNNGFSVKPFLNWARLHHKLEYEDYGKANERRMTVRKTLPGGRARCIALYINNAEWAQNSPHMEDERYTEVYDEDMPF